MAKTNTNMAQQIYTNREQVEEYNYSNIPGQKLKYSCFTLTDNSKYQGKVNKYGSFYKKHYKLKMRSIWFSETVLIYVA